MNFVHAEAGCKTTNKYNCIFWLRYLKIFFCIVAFEILEGVGIDLQSFCMEDHLDVNKIQEDFLYGKKTKQLYVSVFLTHFSALNLWHRIALDKIPTVYQGCIFSISLEQPGDPLCFLSLKLLGTVLSYKHQNPDRRDAVFVNFCLKQAQDLGWKNFTVAGGNVL